jgi:hypothetical protein
MIYDQTRDQVLLFCKDCGDSNGSGGNYETTWKFSGTTWTNLTPSSTQHIAIQNVVMVYHEGNSETYLILYPQGSGGGNFETYKFNHTTKLWDSVAASGLPSPSQPLNSVSAAYDSTAGRILFNFTYSGHIYTYSFNGSAYTSLSDVQKTFYRSVHDKERGRTIAFGPVPPTWAPTYIGATYEFYSGSWSEVITNQVPSFETLVYDSSRKVVVGYGGGSSVNSEIWHYSGTDWIQASPTESPRARINPFLVFDSARNRVLMFGGADRFSQSLRDMWQYAP